MINESIACQEPSGYVPLPDDVLFDEGTGQPTYFNPYIEIGSRVVPFRHWQLIDISSLRSSVVGANSVRVDAAQFITSYDSLLNIDTNAWVIPISSDESIDFIIEPTCNNYRQADVPSVSNSSTTESRSTSIVDSPAKELLSITRLSATELADLFNVSRTAFYKWVNGSNPRNERFKYLLDVLIHVKSASKRLPASVDLSTWLRTPVSAGGNTPLGYLRDRKFLVFRGLVLRAASPDTGLSTTIPLSLPGPKMTPGEREIARARVNPLPRFEDEEE